MAILTYVPLKSRLLRDFDRLKRYYRQVLSSDFSEINADVLFAKSRIAYEALIPQIPFIGKNNPLLVFLIPSAQHLALYRAMTGMGRSLEETGQLIYRLSEAQFKAYPLWMGRLIQRAWFSNWFRSRLRRRAEESHARLYAGNYVFNFIDGQGESFDYGIDYLECASCKFLKQQQAFELAPYVCAVDQVASETLGWGLQRSTTLAEGAACCDFRFKRGGDTRITLPPVLNKK